MARAACKIIINSMFAAAVASLERVVIQWRGSELLPESVADRMIQHMADCDNAAWTGEGIPAGGYSIVASSLHRRGLLSDDVFVILRLPRSTKALQDAGDVFES